MYHELLRDATFWSFLFTIDQDLAQECRKQACPCGGRLHSAKYPRKPRGNPDDLPDEHCRRLSFCCDRDGCRKRTTLHESSTKHRRSFSVNVKKGCFYCQKCHHSGDQFKLWSEVIGLPIRQATIELCRQLGCDVPWMHRW